MERFITAPVQFTGQPDAQGVYRDAQLKPQPGYRPALRLVSLDIETSGVAAVQHRAGELWSAPVCTCSARPAAYLPEAAWPDIALSRRLDCNQQWMARHDPDAIAGWNLVQFDLRLLHEHAKSLQVPLTLGRNGAVMTLRSHAGGGHVFADAPGRLLIDGIEALRSATWALPRSA